MQPEGDRTRNALPDIQSVSVSLQTALEHHLAGRLPQAEAIYKQILREEPNHPDALHRSGLIAYQTGECGAAVDLFDKAIRENTYNPHYFNDLGAALQAQGKFDEAADNYRKALSLKPDYAEAHNNLGVMLKERGNLDEAVACYHKAISFKPDFAEAYNNLGNTLQDQDKVSEAIDSFQSAISLKPDYAEAFSNLGNALQDQGKLDEAIDSFQKALSFKPDFAEAHNNLGGGLRKQGRLSEALACYHKSLSLKPDFADANYSLGTLHLHTDNLSSGWEKYEYRWHKKINPISPRPFPYRWWQGEEIWDKTILVWGEQGVGDELRYASFMLDLPSLAKHCILECEPRLISLFARSFPSVEVIPKSDPPHPRTTCKDIAIQSPVASLARWLRPNLNSFPKHNGYLRVDPKRTEYWQNRIAALGYGLKVGISWRSSRMTSGRNMSHTQIEQWKPIFRVPGVTFVNLQYGECREELERAEQRFGIPIHHWDDIDLKNDLDEVASLTMALDLVISSPSAVTDMPGALGKPVWMMDMRYAHWDDLGQNYSPWYPSMRLFYRDWNDDWTNVIATVAQELELISGKGYFNNNRA